MKPNRQNFYTDPVYQKCQIGLHYSTFILTEHHIIDGMIIVRVPWNPPKSESVARVLLLAIRTYECIRKED